MDAYNQPEDRKARVSIEASDFTCEGLVHLPGIRLSDLMNEKSTFLIVVNATVFHKKLGSADRRPSSTRPCSYGKARSSTSSPWTRCATADSESGSAACRHHRDRRQAPSPAISTHLQRRSLT